MELIKYNLNNEQAELLKSLVLMPIEFRLQLIDKYFLSKDFDELKNVFIEFIGLVNSVQKNYKEVLEVIATTEFDMHPHEAEKINMPSILGALYGVIKANAVSDKFLCSGCAYRKGT